MIILPGGSVFAFYMHCTETQRPQFTLGFITCRKKSLRVSGRIGSTQRVLVGGKVPPASNLSPALFSTWLLPEGGSEGRGQQVLLGRKSEKQIRKL